MMMMVMKTSDISETKQPRAKLNAKCPYEAGGDSSGDQLESTLTYFSGEQNFLQRISRTFFVGSQQNLAALGV